MVLICSRSTLLSLHKSKLRDNETLIRLNQKSDKQQVQDVYEKHQEKPRFTGNKNYLQYVLIIIRNEKYINIRYWLLFTT